MAASSRLELALARRDPLPAGELRGALDVSPATLSRLVAAAGESVLRLGRGRATRYALVRSVQGLPARLPIYRVDEAGKATRAGALTPVAGTGAFR